MSCCQTSTCNDQGQATESTSRVDVYVPQVDLRETKDGVVMTVDLPGVSENDVELVVENRHLTLKARVSPPVMEGYTLVGAEYGTGNFERSFKLSDEIDPSQIEASMADGVLTLRLAKSTPATAHKIPVRRPQ